MVEPDPRPAIEHATADQFDRAGVAGNLERGFLHDGRTVPQGVAGGQW